MSTLREQMQADLQWVGITPKTQHIYMREVANLEQFFGKSPDQLGEAELKDYLLFLMSERGLAQGTYRVYTAGLKFFYRHTLKREDVIANIKYPKRKQTLPVVLSLSAVEALFSATENMKHKALLMITYSAGLRLSETSRLKVTDIDSKRMMVRGEQGKRSKDRRSCPRPPWSAYGNTGGNIAPRNGYSRGRRKAVI